MRSEGQILLLLCPIPLDISITWILKDDPIQTSLKRLILFLQSVLDFRCIFVHLCSGSVVPYVQYLVQALHEIIYITFSESQEMFSLELLFKLSFPVLH